jgi:Icc-related predicted phosphoesterase
MGRSGFYLLLLSILITLSILSGAYQASSQLSGGLEIIDPSYSVAQILKPGSWFSAELRGPPGSIDEASLSAYLVCSIEGKISNISLTISGYMRDGNKYIINLSIPLISIPQGPMYPCSLVINNKGSQLISERSVYLYNKSLTRLGIMHISDVHMLLPTPLGTAFQTLTSAVFLANALSDVDIIINSGDTSDRPGDTELYRYYKAGVRTLLKPLLAAPGNHDGSGISPDLFSSVYESSVGKITWYRRIEGYLIIGLDTSSTGVIDKSQLVFLENVLRSNIDAKTKIIVFHHPVFRASARGTYIDQPLASVPSNLFYASWANAEDIAREFLRIVDVYNVSAVLAGHVHQDSIVIYKNKTIFITTGTLGGPRSEYNAFRLIDAYSNGTVIPRLAPGTSLGTMMNSYNVEKAVIRYWQGELYSGVFINISRDIGLSINSLDIYVEAPKKGDVVIERITYDDGKKQNIDPLSRIEILGEDGGIRTLYMVRIPAQEIHRPQGIVVRDKNMDISAKPSIIDISINPPRPRPNLDPIITSIKVSSGSTYVYRVETKLVITTRSGSSIEIYGEALPSWDYSSYQIIFDKVDAVTANLVVKAYDLYGNTDEKTITIRFREPTTTPVTTPTPITTTTPVTTKPEVTQSPTITVTTTQYEGITQTTTYQEQTTPTTTRATEAPTTTTARPEAQAGWSSITTAVIVLVAAVVLIVALVINMRGRARS